jgi:hypothetical protein
MSCFVVVSQVLYSCLLVLLLLRDRVLRYVNYAVAIVFKLQQPYRFVTSTEEFIWCMFHD